MILRPRLLRSLGCALVLLIASPAAAADKLTLMLDWFVNPDHAPILVADKLGYFADRDLEVEIIAPADPNDPPKLVAAGQADIAISYQPQLHIQIDQGLPLTRIGTLVATPLNTLVALDDGPIDEIADLKGGKIGFSVGGFEHALLVAMLARHGLTPDDVELINVNFALSPALLSGQVDAVIGAYRNFELNQLDRVRREAVPGQHGSQQRVLEAANREADLAAGEVGDRLDRAVGQHHQRVERGRDQRADARERQALVDLDVELRLVADRDLGLAGRDQLGRIVGVGRGDDLDLEPGIGKIAQLLRDDDRRMVGIDEPVEQQRQLIGGARRSGQGEPEAQNSERQTHGGSSWFNGHRERGSAAPRASAGSAAGRP